MLSHLQMVDTICLFFPGVISPCRIVACLGRGFDETVALPVGMGIVGVADLVHTARGALLIVFGSLRAEEQTVGKEPLVQLWITHCEGR